LISLLLVLTPFVLIILFKIFEPIRLNVVIVWLVAGISMMLVAFGVLRGNKPYVVIGAFSVFSFIISGHNGVAFHDRLHTYTRFIGVNAILETVEAQYPQISRFRDFVIWNESRFFGAFAHAVRGVSQPIGTHATTLWMFQNPSYGYELASDVIVLSEDWSILEKISETLSGDYKIVVNSTIELPSIDSAGNFRGYILNIKRQHAYDKAIIPSGENIRNTGASVAWTGPESNVVMEFNLPAPANDVYAELCGVMSILPLGFRLPAVVNDVSVMFLRQPNTEACNFLYHAKIPKVAINTETPVELAFTIPTAPADKVFHNGDRELYGLAISAVTFRQNAHVDPYNDPIAPRGMNIHSEPTRNGDIGPLFWTGEGSDVFMTFNLPSPTSDVEVELCGNMSIVTLDEQLSAAINGMPISFYRQQPTELCNLLYVAEIPQAAITADALTELAIIIPATPADQFFHNGDMRPLGMALVAISFNTQDMQ
jgi:hypothetical protein